MGVEVFFWGVLLSLADAIITKAYALILLGEPWAGRRNYRRLGSAASAGDPAL